MHFRVSHQSQCGLYQRRNQIACQKIRWYLHYSGDMSVYSTLFSQTFFGLLFCYLTITDVTMYLQIIDFQFPSCCTSQPKKLNQIITVNSSTNTSITKKITLARFACLCLRLGGLKRMPKAFLARAAGASVLGGSGGMLPRKIFKINAPRMAKNTSQ